MENYKELIEIIDYQAKVLVWTLLKRIEVLDKEKVLTVSLYKALVKEHIYEQFRSLKKLIELKIKIGKIVFITEKPKKSKEQD